MQQVEKSDPREMPEGRKFLSPTKALVAVLALGALGALSLSFVGDRTPVVSSKPETRQPDFSLTNEEALARFRELEEMRVQAYRERDVTLIRLYVTSDSPLLRLGTKDIRKLLRTRVLFEPDLTTRRLQVLENSPDQILIRQKVIERANFLSENGTPLRPSRRPLKLVIDWSLRQENSEWKFYDSTVRKSAFLTK